MFGVFVKAFGTIIFEKRISVGQALVFMESFVFLQAVVVAICDLFALANGFQDVLVVAPFTNANFKLFTVFKGKGELIIFRWSELYHDGRMLSKSKFTKSNR